MARAFPAPPMAEYGVQPSTGDWQALRGELVALLDQVEGQYAQQSGNPALAGFAQRVRDLRYQVSADDDDGDDRRREALRSVKRQIERFNDRGEPETIPHADNVLQSAIQQIRTRTQSMAPAPAPRMAPAYQAAPQPMQTMPAPPMPRFDDLANAMAGLSGRLEQLEAELKAQRGNATQVKEIADQVAQLSHVVELLAGAVGETGQVKRLESQIAGLAQMVAQAPRTDLTQLTERLDQVVATVDRLADLQVQQIRHVVEEAESAPAKDSETLQGLRAIEASVRNIYDRIDTLESSNRVAPDQLERVSEAVANISARLEGDSTARPDRLLSLVDALNGRINEIEDRGDALGGLRHEIDGLRVAVLGAIEPRFMAIESQIGALGERLATPPAVEVAGVAQLEAQVRQLVARMDQTSEQLGELARLYSDNEERQPAPDLEALVNLAATRSFEAMQRQQPAPVPVPDFEALAQLAASKASAAVKADTAAPLPPPNLSEASLAAIEDRISRLVEGLAKARPPEGPSGMQQGIERVEDRLARLEAALTRRDVAPASGPMPAPGAVVAPAAAPMAMQMATAIPAEPILPPSGGPSAPQIADLAEGPRDAMPRNPAADAPLREFGFPDLGPVRAALEAKNGPRKRQPGASVPDAGPAVQAAAEPAGRPASAAGPALSFNPANVERPPRPVSSLDVPAEAPFAPAAAKAPLAQAAEVSTASRNTFIEAARRAAQRRSTPQRDSNSLIGKAFARLQPSAPSKPVPLAPMPEPAPVPVAAAMPDFKEPSVAGDAQKPRLGKLRSRQAKAEPAPRKPEPVPEPTPKPFSSIPVDDAPEQSWLSKYRRPILLAASLVAVSFMALNLVAQRFTADQPAAADASQQTAPADASPTPSAAPVSPSPAAAKPADKPVSELATPADSDATSQQTAEAAPGPRLTPLTDPVTTASINPGAAMAFAPATSSDAMPPALTAVNDAAGQPGSTPQCSRHPSPPTPGPRWPAPAAAATPAVADPGAAGALESPVKVELPADGVGPQDLRQAAADGDARAQFEIGAIYSEGRAIAQDYKQAVVWYERAAAQGFGPAQYRLGNLYENGKGVDKDLEQARLWYQRAAEAGNRMAMHNLAALYAGGQFGKQDFASAAEWFEHAADLGMKDSQFNLGMLYARGLGVPQNLETSYKWFALAATGGDAEAIKARDNVARSLDAEAVKRAAAAVSAFKLTTVNLVANFAPIGTWEKNFNPGPAVTNKDVVQKVQVALMRLGFDVGTPDGHAGPKTGDAIKAFERGTGMSEVGQINPRLLAVLGSQPV